MTHSHRRPSQRKLSTTALAVVVPLTVATSVLAAPALADDAPQFTWTTVVNNGDLVPGSQVTKFNSYNQPSVSSNGLVVFRARTKGPSPIHGVYTRDALVAAADVVTVANGETVVPPPNTTGVTFTEFPSFPRIDENGSMVATRGQSEPVYTLPDGTKLGTSGIYATVGGVLTTGASLLGAVPAYDYYAVPGAAPGTRFDQFPGAPAVDGTTVVFKGNYTEGTDGRTGVFVRDLSSPDNPVRLIANSDTRIPNQPTGTNVTFGSTAPPSAAAGKMVFVGLDDEGNPSLGGIYLAKTTGQPVLKTLVGIGDQVPGESKADTFRGFGEGLSFDGRFVGFWGWWGDQTQPISVVCPEEGNQALKAACSAATPPTSVPLHQGVFVYDTATSQVRTVVTTGQQFGDFLYWVFSGRPPGTGGTEEDTLEGPRWRSSAFVAVSGVNGATYQVAFKASPVVGGSGIYLGRGPGNAKVVTVVDTSTAGRVVDAEASANSLVSSVGLERDGFRGRNLAVAVSMVGPEESDSWAGVYLTRVPASAAG